MTTPIAFLTNLVFLTHDLIPMLLCVVLMLHELPPFDISVHLVHTARLNRALLYDLFIITLFLIVLCEILRVTVQWA